MNSRKVYFNGEFVDENQAKVSIYDSSLMFGDMVFEMTRSFNKKQFKLEEHIDRLLAGLRILEINLKKTKNELIEICLATQAANEHLFQSDDEHRLMIDVSRGTLGIYKEITGLWHEPNLIVADFPLRWTVAGMSELFEKGINAVITSQRAIPSELLDPKIKNRSRIHYLRANIEVSKMSGERNWALLLDTQGNISEGTGDNFFIVKNDSLITPNGKDILRGISRDYVIHDLAKQIGFTVYEKNIDIYDAYTADEAFMTGTPFCMLPVTSLNSVAIGSGQVGPVFDKLITTWGNNVGINIRNQIAEWDSGILPQGATPYKFK